MPGQLMPIETILSVLGETPQRLRLPTAGLSESLLRARPEPGEWSETEIVAHLRSCADVWGDAIETIVTTDHPTIRAVNPTTWIDSTDYRELQFATSLRAFTKQRDRLMSVVAKLTHATWSRGATVLGAGKPLDRTVHSYADRLARHERAHWKQVVKTATALQG